MRRTASRASITVFVSFAHGDGLLVERFLQLMRLRLTSLRDIEINLVVPPPAGEDRNVDVTATADFGLLCVTPNLLASSYVSEVEVPALVATGAALVPVAMEPLHAVGTEVRALEDLLVFHYRAPGRTGGRSFSECHGADRHRFCDALVAMLTERLAGARAHAATVTPESTMIDGSSPPRDSMGAGTALATADRGLVEDLVQRMTPDIGVPSESEVRQAQRNAAARTALLREFGARTSEQIGEEHSRARNRHALAARWRKEGRMFGVPYHGRMVYPAFQFDATSGELRPAVKAVLSALPVGRMSQWEVALWWTAANGWLGGRRPVDLLDDDPETIVGAAGRLASSPL